MKIKLRINRGKHEGEDKLNKNTTLIAVYHISDYYAFIKEVYSFYLYRREITYIPIRSELETLRFSLRFYFRSHEHECIGE